jgi:hypothetical protein
MRTHTKRLLWSLPILLLLSTACTAYDSSRPVTRYGPDIRIEVFYDSLSPYGDWTLLDGYGWVWLPGSVGIGWRPYTNGRWVYSNFGWTWSSYWDWGWAPFHNGRWHLHPHHGWVWIPGRQWAPAWVAWRAGDGWYGWAPLPPSVGWRVGVGLDLGGLDLHLGIASERWSFVAERHLLDHDLRPNIAPTERHAALLRSTRDVTRYREEANRVVGRSLAIDQVEQKIGRAIPRYRVEELGAPPERGSRSVGPDVLHVYRPKVKGAAAKRAPTKGKSRGRGGF